MKNIFLLAAVAAAFVFSGCEMKKPADTEMDGMKCQAGKCETGKCKGAPKPAAKPEMKCQPGKCGGN